MYPALQALIHEAEHTYLQQSDLDQLLAETSTLRARLQVYRTLRDGEIDIFQSIADKLVSKLSDEKTHNLEHCLRHWLSITRYCAMAMLLNNPEYLDRTLLEWLTDIVQAHESQKISAVLYSLLIKKLEDELPDGLPYIKPYLTQAHEHIQQIPVLTA